MKIVVLLAACSALVTAMSSPYRYQSRLFNFITWQFHRFAEARNRTQLHLRSAVLRGIQIVLYPMYWLFRATPLAGKQLHQSASAQQQPSLQAGAQDSPQQVRLQPGTPATDRSGRHPIVRALRGLMAWVQRSIVPTGSASHELTESVPQESIVYVDRAIAQLEHSIASGWTGIRANPWGVMGWRIRALIRAAYDYFKGQPKQDNAIPPPGDPADSLPDTWATTRSAAIDTEDSWLTGVNHLGALGSNSPAADSRDLESADSSSGWDHVSLPGTGTNRRYLTGEPQTLGMTTASPASSQPVISSAKKRWIDTKATTMGYIKHPLERILEWLDRIMLWLEGQLLRVWRWLRRL